MTILTKYWTTVRVYRRTNNENRKAIKWRKDETYEANKLNNQNARLVSTHQEEDV